MKQRVRAMDTLCVCEGCLFFYQDVASNVGDLHRQRQHIELAHHLQDELGIHPRQLQQVEQVRRVAREQKNIIICQKHTTIERHLHGLHVRSPVEVPDVLLRHRGPLHLQHVSGQLRQAVALAADQLLG